MRNYRITLITVLSFHCEFWASPANVVRTSKIIVRVDTFFIETYKYMHTESIPVFRYFLL